MHLALEVLTSKTVTFMLHGYQHNLSTLASSPAAVPEAQPQKETTGRQLTGGQSAVNKGSSTAGSSYTLG